MVTDNGNIKPQVAILTSAGEVAPTTLTVSSTAKFKISVSDSDGSVKSVTWKVTNASGVSIESGAYTTVKANMDLEVRNLNAGNYVLSITAMDDLGASSTATVNFVVDATAPSITALTVDGAVVADGATLERAIGAQTTLKVTATDSGSNAAINIYRGSTLIGQGVGAVSVDLTGTAAGSSIYTVVAVDSVGNSTAQTFTVNYAATNTTTPAPSPVIIVNNTDPQPYTNTLSVTVSAGVAAGVGTKQLILEVTDSKGIVDTTTYAATTENATFNIDTTKYPDGALKLRAIAVDSKDQRGISAVTTVQIANTVAPTISIVTPTNGAQVKGPTPVTIQIRENNTAFSFTDNLATLEIIDSRGQVVNTQKATLTKINTGLWQAVTTVDFESTQYLNASYTLRATTGVLLTNETTARTVTAVSTVDNKSVVPVPPALNILIPSFYDPSNPNNPAGTLAPILTRKSAVAVQVSDSDKVVQVQLQFVCDPANVAVGQTCNTTAYNFNLPGQDAGLFYRVFNTGVLIDGQPFVPNGNYTMRASATDEAGNSNVKEIKVVVDRSKSGIANLSSNKVDIYDDGKSKLTPTAAEWGISPSFTQTVGWDRTIFDKTANLTRVIAFVYDSNAAGIAREMPSRIGIEAQAPVGSTISNGFGFGTGGVYATAFLVQDMNTGVVEWYDGTDVVVTAR